MNLSGLLFTDCTLFEELKVLEYYCNILIYIYHVLILLVYKLDFYLVSAYTAPIFLQLRTQLSIKV
jgi:hypothetical protein